MSNLRALPQRMAFDETPIEQFQKQIAEITIEELLAMWNSLDGRIEQDVLRMAALWQRLKSLGVDMHRFTNQITGYVDRVCEGDVSAKLVAQFAGQWGKLALLACLPRSKQDEITAGEGIPVAIPSKDSGRIYDVVKLQPCNMEYQKLRSCLDGSRIRPVEEQAKAFTSEVIRTSRSVTKKARMAIRSGQLYFDDKFRPIQDVIDFLRSHGEIE